MEHRWGKRVAMRLPVELSGGSRPAILGSMENLSASGAFVRTRGASLPRGPVAVRLAGPAAGRARTTRIPGYIVRVTEDGVGLEWRQFAPSPVRELLSRAVKATPATPRPARVVPVRRRRAHRLELAHMMLSAVVADSLAPSHTTGGGRLGGSGK
jgi:hypothetical protein